MYLNDARDVARPRKIEPAPRVDPRIAAFLQEGRGAGRGHTVSKPQRGLMQRNVCLFENGRHVYAGENCPHYREAPAELPVEPGPEPILFRPMRPR